mmetsp:Transcript_16645/g.38244  ORF Transcript_16645/g.38244 Transcript_16645/m.38244 type:complete len:109 (+) Transcript_16645:2050-2376(+)
MMHQISELSFSSGGSDGEYDGGGTGGRSSPYNRETYIPETPHCNGERLRRDQLVSPGDWSRTSMESHDRKKKKKSSNSSSGSGMGVSSSSSSGKKKKKSKSRITVEVV